PPPVAFSPAAPEPLDGRGSTQQRFLFSRRTRRRRGMPDAEPPPRPRAGIWSRVFSWCLLLSLLGSFFRRASPPAVPAPTPRHVEAAALRGMGRRVTPPPCLQDRVERVPTR